MTVGDILCAIGLHNVGGRNAEWTSGANYWYCARCHGRSNVNPYI